MHTGKVNSLQRLANTQANSMDNLPSMQLLKLCRKASSYTYLQATLGAFAAAAYCLCFISHKCAGWVSMKSVCNQANLKIANADSNT